MSETQGKRTSIRLTGRVLYLAEDPAELKAQLYDGKRLRHDPQRKLVDNISTDELTPGWVCYYYDETLARYCLVGLRGNHVQKDAIANGGFQVIVSGLSKGCGSSRETAPFSELKAGVQIVFARTIEKIYGQNCQNIGLLTSTDFSLLERLERGEELSIHEFTKGLDEIATAIVESGGLFAYNRRRLAGEIVPKVPQTGPRPMTLVEKIVASRAIADAKTGRLGIPAVQPGDALFVRTDVRFSHEYVTPMAESLFKMGLGKDARIQDPASVYAFRDHLTFLDRVMPEAHVKMGLREQAASLATVQERFAGEQGVRLYGEVERDGRVVGSEGICHNIVIEEIALPGQVVVGTDSHTCMAGALGCFAFGVGSTDMANSWFTKDVRVRVPETARVNLRGALRPGATAKDVMLLLLSHEFFKTGKGIGKVLEFGGPGVDSLSLDERATLTNMAVEAGGFTGIVAAEDVVLDYLVQMRGLQRERLLPLIQRPDPDARYLTTFDIDLATIEPMIATPGDPRNGVPLRELRRDLRIDIAYGGSCTGGKKADMDMYASAVRRALAKGRTLPAHVKCYIQFGSQKIRDYAETMGYVQLFQQAGIELIDPSCGACIKAGPGVSDRPDQVTVSAINRNFPGRSGPGQVYLASPLVVAASAFLGRIGSPDEL
ncbi:MAG: 3-isopropylmalate dehydratase [Planctomycetes bacterium]|nr:3-isopropylmalate dehydratase [Planctomycetota bacterium]